MKLSIIIPIYNTEKYLIKCIESLLTIETKDYEIILVNDGSPDNSFKIINAYIKKYLNISAINKPNGGLSSARNIGIEKAKGEYITFVDSDDYVEKDFLLELLKPLENKKVDLLVSGVNKDEIILGKTIKYRFPNKKFDLKTPIAQEYIMKHDVLGSSFMHGKVFRKDIINKYKLEFKHVTPHEDSIFFFEYLNYCKIGIFTNYGGYHYVIHPTPSLTKKLPNYSTSIKISNYLKIIYSDLFKNYSEIKSPYIKRITSEYGIDQRIIAWYDIYLNKRLKRVNRLKLMQYERGELRKWVKEYGYKARRQNHQYFSYLLISSLPIQFVDFCALLFFNILKKK